MKHNRTHSNSGPSDNSSPDELLRRRFAGLRREEQQWMPEFATTWAQKTSVPRSWKRWFAVATCALIALATLLWMRSTKRPENNTVASITEWKAPTDFLLETPGRELLRTVPEIGAWRGYIPVPLPVTRSSPARKQVLH